VIDRWLSSCEDRRLVQQQISCDTEAWLGALLNCLALLGPPVCMSLLCAIYLKTIICIVQLRTHTHNRFTARLEYVRDHPGEQVPER